MRKRAQSGPSDAEIALEKNCGPKEKERAERRAIYRVVFKEEDGAKHEFTAQSLEQFQELALGESRTIRVTANHEVTLVP